MGSASLQRPWPTNLRARSAEEEGSTGAGFPAVWATRAPPARATDNSSAACRLSDPARTLFPLIVSSPPMVSQSSIARRDLDTNAGPEGRFGPVYDSATFRQDGLPDAPTNVSGVWRDEPTKVRATRTIQAAVT